MACSEQRNRLLPVARWNVFRPQISLAAEWLLNVRINQSHPWTQNKPIASLDTGSTNHILGHRINQLHPWTQNQSIASLDTESTNHILGHRINHSHPWTQNQSIASLDTESINHILRHRIDQSHPWVSMWFKRNGWALTLLWMFYAAHIKRTLDVSIYSKRWKGFWRKKM